MAKKNFKKPKEWEFKGKKYKFIWKRPPKKYDAVGLCTCPDARAEDRIIWIDPNLSQEDLLRVVADEIFHAHFFEINNKAVQTYSTNLGTFLYKMGFRLKE